jgi:hypothetical protein
LLLSIVLLTLLQISSLKLKQSGGHSLEPDQEVKIAREDALLQSLRTLQEQHPEEAAAFASKSAPKTAPVSGSIVPDVLECPVDDDMAGACKQQVRAAVALVRYSILHVT